MAINLTDSLNAATTKGKLGDAKQVFLNGDTKSLQQAHEETNAHLGTLDNRSTQMENAIKDISVSGGASTASAVSYDNSASKLEAVTAQGALDELKANIIQETARAKAAEEANATSIIGTERIADGAITYDKLQDEIKEVAESNKYVENLEFIRYFTDADGRLLWWINADGSIDWSKGVPQPIQKELKKLEQLINDNLTGDEQLKERVAANEDAIVAINETIDKKVDGVYEENPEFIRIYKDADGRLLWWINADGSVDWAKGVPQPVQEELKKLEQNMKIFGDYIDDSDYIRIIQDNTGKILFGVDKDGNVVSKTTDDIKDELKRLSSNTLTTNDRNNLDFIDSSRTSLFNQISELARFKSVAKAKPYIEGLEYNPERDVYVTHVGSSSSAWQVSELYAPEGICEVPPTCDKQGLAWALWQSIVFGNPHYRRFDYGKASLVSDYTDKWTDDSESFFSEVGEFKTCYQGRWIQEGALTTTTKVDSLAPFPIDSADFQRHIPHRYSNTASAKVTFKIPAGYTKCNFIYTSNDLSDVVSITTNRDNGVVKYSDSPNDKIGTEANNKEVDMSFSTIGGTLKDTIGIHSRCMYFYIKDTSVDTIITITKSTDTSKYLIYWGAVYWGTSKLPNALLFTNYAVGGYGDTSIANRIDTYINASKPTILTYQLCSINSWGTTNATIDKSQDMIDKISTMDEYLSAKNISRAYILQHNTLAQINSGNEDVIMACYNRVENYLRSNNIPLLGNLNKLFQDTYVAYYKNDYTWKEFITMLLYDDAHLNTVGFQGWRALFEG